jgi:hypothetical protein
MKQKVMKMVATVDITGYTTTSGSKPLLNEIKATFMVTNKRTKTIAMVATTTDRIAGKSANVIPQNR